MAYKLHGKGHYVLVPNLNNPRIRTKWPISWQNTGYKVTASCRYCGKKIEGVGDFRNGWTCRVSGGKRVGRLVPADAAGFAKKPSVWPDKNWDFVCKDCEPARRADWCRQQGIRDRIEERGGKK